MPEFDGQFGHSDGSLHNILKIYEVRTRVLAERAFALRLAFEAAKMERSRNK